MGKSVRLVASAALVIGLAGLATWWLLSGRVEDSRQAAGSAGAPAVASRPGLEASEAQRGSALPAAADEAVSNVVAEGGESAATEPGNPITFTGRVLDDAGRPVRDAEVVHLASEPMREATGTTDPSRYMYTPWERFTRARTDGLGRFSLPTRELPERRSPLLDVSGSSSGGLGGRLPRLIVLHPAVEPTVFYAFAFARGESDVGDLVVAACGGVIGRLVDETGQPLAGVPVGLAIGDMPASPPPYWELLRDLPRASSGPDGRFDLGGLWNATLSVEFNTPDFIVTRKEVTVKPHEVVDLGDVVLLRGGAISGWVLAAGGAPIEGARILIRMDGMGRPSRSPDAAALEEATTYFYGGQAYEVRTLSGADGSFRAAGLDSNLPNGWRVIAGARGYEGSMQRAVKPGETPLRFELQPVATLMLRVHEPGTATVVAGTTVKAWRVQLPTEGEPEPWPVSIDALREGDAWRLLGAGPQRNEVLVSAPGRATTGFELPGVAPAAVLEHAVELPPESVIAGIVHDERDAPLAGASVRALPPEDLPVKQLPLRVVTDGDGRFELHGLGEGRWTIGASAAECVPTPPVELTPGVGERIDGVEFELARGGSIAGRILVRDPRAVLGWQVIASPTDETPRPDLVRAASFVWSRGASLAPDAQVSWKGVIDDRGEYLIQGLPPGEYRVHCEPGAEGFATVTAGEQTRLDLALRERPRVRGRVTSAGVPVEGAKVTVISTFGKFTDEAASAVTDAAGEYAFTLDGEGPDYGAEVTARWKEAKTRNVAIHPRFDHEEVADLAFGGGALAGEVVDELGAPVVLQVNWRAEPREGFTEEDEVDARQDSDATGHFRLELVPEGKGVLMLGKRGYVGVTLRDLVVREGQTTTVPRIVLAQGGAIEVHMGGAPDEDRDPMKRYLIRVRSLADTAWGSREQHVRFGTTSTFRDIPAGSVEIDVLKPTGGQRFELFRTVPAVVVVGETLRFDQPVTE